MRRFFTNFFVKSRKFFIRIRRKDDIMEKGPSEYAKYWTSDYNELYHFYAHADEFGYVLIRDYSKAAVDFLNRDDEDIESFTAKDGRVYKYDPNTNELLISRDGKIVNYFPPINGEDYFYGQFDKVGDFWN